MKKPQTTTRALALLVAASFAVGITSSSAQTVPVPKPAPKARERDNAQNQMSASEKAPLTTGAAQQPPTPIIPDRRRNQPANIFATFDDKQKAQAAKVSNYLSSLQQLSGNFVQV